MQSFFDIFGLPPAFTLDMKALEKAYFAAQGAAHPDRFVGKPEEERMRAIETSQRVNDAYETLKNPLRRAEHLLELHNIHALADDAKVSAETLSEMLDLRERIFESGEDGAALAAMVNEIRALADENFKALEKAFADADYVRATEETIRLQYLGKAMEEAHMLIYRMKAAHG